MRSSFGGKIAFLSLLLASCGKAAGSDGAPVGDAGASGESSSATGGSGAGLPGAGSGGTTFAGTGGKVSGGGGTSDPGEGGADAGAGPGGAGSTGDAGASSVSLDGSPIYTRVQRLTNSQWSLAVRDILRLSPTVNLAEGFVSPSAGVSDFTNNEKSLFVDDRVAVDFELAAEAAASLATGSAEALAALYAGTDRDTFVREFGRRAFRRPLTPEQETKYQGVFAQGEALYGSGFAHGAALVIRAMLESPYFLYRSELGPAGDPLDGYEVASKLSFWLLGTTPSDALLDAAAAGALDSPEGLETSARQMLDDAAALEVMRDFHGQLYQLNRYAVVNKVGVAEYSSALNPELSEASYRFFDEVFARGQGLREILTSPQGFVGPGLAPLYGLGSPPSSLEKVELGPSRIGYFMQVPFLLLNGINQQSDPIRRGLSLHLDVLCGSFPPVAPPLPPLPPLEPGQTNRQRISELTDSCGSACHRYINPLGFAFENFDGMGESRAVDNGQLVDTTGSYPFAEGERDFADARELMMILANSDQAHTCYAKKVSGYALQRDIVQGDSPLLASLAAVSRTRSLKEMVVSLVRDPAFRLRQQGTP